MSGCQNKSGGSRSVLWFQSFVLPLTSTGEAALPDRRPARGDAAGRFKLLPPHLAGSGAGDGHRSGL